MERLFHGFLAIVLPFLISLVLQTKIYIAIYHSLFKYIKKKKKKKTEDKHDQKLAGLSAING